MAEGLLFNIAEAILKSAAAPALQEIGTLLGVKDELSKLSQTVPRIQAVLLDAEEKQAHNNQDRQWLDELKELVYDADDLLDDFATEALRRQAMGGWRVIKEARLFFSRSNQLVYGHIMAGKIKAVREKLNTVADERQKHRLDVLPKEKDRQETDSSRPDVFVGREGEREEIIRLLLDEKIAPIISIVGIGGIGKTALAQVIFNDYRVQNHFELKEWVFVSDPFDVKMVYKKILESATNGLQEILELNTMLRLLKEKMGGKKFLVVLDDVWSKDGEKWDSIRKLLREGARGSKIIVTTRFKEVARIASPSFHGVTVESLSLGDSWSLLKQMVFGEQEVKNTYVVTVGEKIVRKCDGVPLAIKSIGNLLRLHDDPETEWSHFVNQDPLITARNENEILPTLRTSYDHLPSHLKHCFAYCSLFPKDSVIDVECLIHLWVGQGFITKSADASQSLEDIGLEYFMDLLRRSFFQEVEKDTLRNVKSCKLTHLMHRLATTVAMTECRLLMQEEDRIDGKIRHVSLNFDLEPPQEIPAFLNGADQLRTFLLPCQVSTTSSARRWEESSCKALFSNFRRLRVFDLHDIGIENVSSSIKKLKQTRYLDVSRNGIMSLPRSIVKLQNLQVLKLSDCKELRELPKDISKLVNLKHIYNDGCLSLLHMPVGLGNLTSLQTLTWFVVSKDGPMSKHIGGLSELKRLNNLRGRMEIRNLGFRKAGEAEFKAANLGAKHFLQSLTLRWNGDGENMSAEAIVNQDEKSLSGLQPHPNLRELQVYEYGGVSFPSWLSSLTNLVNIRLDHCQRCQSLPPLSPIHSLRELCIIDLTDLEYIVNEKKDHIVRSEEEAEFFPSLKTLVLLNCPKLKGWRKGTGDRDAISPAALPQFPHLSLLEVKNCPELISMPRLPSPNGRLTLKSTTSLDPVEQLPKIKMMLTPNQVLRWLAIPTNLVEIFIADCKGFEQLPALDQIAFLSYVDLENLADLKYIDTENDNSEGEGLAFFPFLKKLWIWDCPNLRGWQKKRGSENRATGTTMKELPQFPCLSLLDIRNCPHLSSMPGCSPTLEEKLYLSNSSHVPIPSNLPSFINLTQIWIKGFPNLEFLDIERESYITGGERSTIFPFLKKLWLENCPLLKGWWREDEGPATKTEDFPLFACLSFLEIRHCPQLSWMPLFPTLEERFYFVNSGLRSYPTTLSSFTNLKELWVSDVAGLKCIESEVDVASLTEEAASTFFPHLEILYIYRCPDLKGWWKTEDDTETTTKKLPQFPRLSLLEIRDCPQLTLMPLFPNLQKRFYFVNSGLRSYPTTLSSFTNLKELWISDVAGLKFIENEVDVASLTEEAASTFFPHLEKLYIYGCPNLKGWWKTGDDTETTTGKLPHFPHLSLLEIKNCPQLTLMPLFPTLETLYIESCPELTSLPKGMHHLTSLQKLEIWYCPQFVKERCERNKGADWPNIAHIPHIVIDGKEI